MFIVHANIKHQKMMFINITLGHSYFHIHTLLQTARTVGL